MSHGAILALFPSFSVFLLHFLALVDTFNSHSTLIAAVSLLQCFLLFVVTRKAILKSSCIISLLTGVFFGAAILFGAHPLGFWSNLSWSFLMASMVSVPAIQDIGTELQHWTRVFIEHRFKCPKEQLVLVGACSTVLGAWVGAFPILLDWNREWQVWPLPCSLGALIGNFFSYGVGSLFLFGKGHSPSKTF